MEILGVGRVEKTNHTKVTLTADEIIEELRKAKGVQPLKTFKDYGKN
jgi:hypothetical protein